MSEEQNQGNKEKGKRAATVIAEIKDKALGAEQAKLKGEIEKAVAQQAQHEAALEQTNTTLADLAAKWDALVDKRKK